MLAEIADRVWVLDFEFEIQAHSIIPRPVCLVAREFFSREEITLAGEELRSAVCPFRCDNTEIFVGYFVCAEAHCFLELGWPLPPHWIDLWAEAKRLSNGRPWAGLGLLDVMRRYNLPARDSAHKGQMQTLVGTGAWKPDDMPAIVNYCREDVSDTVALLHAMSPEIAREAPNPNSRAAWAQAILRGRFMAECAAIERRGIPFDAAGWARIGSLWDDMKGVLIDEVDSAFKVFSNGSFSTRLFESCLARNSIPWPRRLDGRLALDEDTFRRMAKVDVRIATLRELRVALAQMRMTRLSPESDGRVRTSLSPFRSKTGRNQPSGTKYPFGNARWLRSFIVPGPGEVFAYLDYRSQEVAIAAYLSGDEALAATYQTGDPYMDFAVRAGLAPSGATKATHKDVRARCKVVVLAVQYGMSAEGIAAAGGMPLEIARELLQRHKEAYPRFWIMAERQMDRIGLGLEAYTPGGWRYQIGYGSDPTNPRSSANWVIQSTGADIMRLAVIRCSDADIPVVATVHDALAFIVPQDRAEEMLQVAAREMEAAAQIVCGGPIGVDIHRVESGQRYEDEGGVEFFRRVMAKADHIEAESNSRGNPN